MRAAAPRALAALAVAATLAAACGGRVPTKRHYVLHNDLESFAAPATGPVCATPLVIASVRMAAPYRDDKIVFRTDAYEVRHFHYRRWVTPPGEMIQSLLARRIDAAGLFPAVESAVHASSDHLALYAVVDRLEERDGPDGWNAALEMRFHLKRSGDDAVIWRHELAGTRPVQEESVPAVVAALSEIYNRGADEMLASLAARLRGEPACRPETDALESAGP